MPSGASPGRSGLPQRDAAGLGPAEAFQRGAARLVLAADPALVAARVELGEQPAVVEVASIGLSAVGRVGDLVVAREAGILPHRDGDVAVLHLTVIDVELQAEIWLADLVDDGAGLAQLIEKVAWNVAPVDGLDHGADTRGGRPACGLLEIGNEDLAARSLMHEPRHHMDQLA